MQITPRNDEMNASESRAELAALTEGLLASLGAPVLRPFLADWPASRDSRPAAQLDAVSLPVLRWLPRIAADLEARTPRIGSALVCALCRAAPLLAWRQSYTLNQVGTAFLENYGWTELLGPRSQEMPGQIACGLLLLGPHTLYPHHRHEAEEIYVPLYGTAEWQQGDAIWRQRAPGALIHHRSEEAHAMRTDAEPLLALYLWRGANLSEQARLDRPDTAARGAP